MEKLTKIFGVLLILIGFICNEYVLTNAFSDDGMLFLSTKIVIWFFDVLCIGTGVLIHLSQRFRNLIKQLEVNYGLLSNTTFLIQSLLTVIFVLALFMQASSLISGISINQDNHGIIYATNMDAGDQIEHTLNTTLISGGTRGHGVLYFRLAHYMAKLSPYHIGPSTDNSEIIEQQAHFALQAISLLSVYLFAFLLAFIVVRNILFSLLSVIVFSSSILYEGTWTEFIFRAHPDLLLMVLTAVFIFLLYKWKSKLDSKSFYLACLAGGACLSTKLIFIMFLPGLIVLVMPPIRLEAFKELCKLYFGIYIAYLCLAFPVSINLMTSVSWLKGQSEYSIWPTMDSFFDWWIILIEQSWLPLSMIVILFLLFGKATKEKQDKKQYLWLRFSAVAFMPFIFLLTQNLIYEHRHYTLPFVSILLTSSALLLPYLSFGWLVKLRSWFTTDIAKCVMAIVLFVSVEMSIGIVPSNVEIVLNKVLENREEVSLTYKKINNYLRQGKIVLTTPYVPFNHFAYDKVGLTGQQLGKEARHNNLLNADILALNNKRHYSHRVGEELSDYVKLGDPQWQEHRELYRLFYQKSEAIDPLGQTWLKTYEDNHGVEIWEKQ